MDQFNVSGPYEDYKVSVTCIFKYGGYIVSVKYIFPICPINAALQQQPTVCRLHARSSLRHKHAWPLRLGTERRFVVWETCPCRLRRISLEGPQLCPVNYRAKPWLEGNMQTENGRRSGQWRRHISQHKDVNSRRRHLTSLCPTTLSFFPFSSCFTSSLMFADRQCLWLPENYFQNSTIRSAGYKTKLSSAILSTRCINPHKYVAIYW